MGYLSASDIVVCFWWWPCAVVRAAWCGMVSSTPMLFCISNDQPRPHPPQPHPRCPGSHPVGLSIAAARGGPHSRNCHTELNFIPPSRYRPYYTHIKPSLLWQKFLIEYQMRYSLLQVWRRLVIEPSKTLWQSLIRQPRDGYEWILLVRRFNAKWSTNYCDRNWIILLAKSPPSRAWALSWRCIFAGQISVCAPLEPVNQNASYS